MIESTSPTDKPLPGIADLISLLDRDTLDALSKRLHKVLDGTESPSQLLFGFIDAGIEDLELDVQYPDSASSILGEIDRAL